MSNGPVTRKSPALFFQELYLDSLVRVWSVGIGAEVKNIEAWQLRQGVQSWRRFLRGRTVFFADVTPSDLEAFKVHLKARGVHFDSMRAWLKGVTLFHAWLAAQGYKGRSPVKEVKERSALAGLRAQVERLKK